MSNRYISGFIAGGLIEQHCNYHFQNRNDMKKKMIPVEKYG